MEFKSLLPLVATGVRHAPHIQGCPSERYCSGVTTVNLVKSEDDRLTYSFDMSDPIIKQADVFSLNHIRVEYEGSGKINELLKCYAIKCHDVRHVWGDVDDRLAITCDMQFFNGTMPESEYVKNYDGIAVFNTFFDYLCPNGLYCKFFREKPTQTTFLLKLNDMDGIEIKAIRLISKLYWLDDKVRKDLTNYDTLSLYVKDNYSQAKHNKIYGNKYVCSRTHVHNSGKTTETTFIRINGICNGFFIKTNCIDSLKTVTVNMLSEQIVHLDDKAYIGTYATRFGDWLYIPFDTYKRIIREIRDCFVFNANGAPDLSRIDCMTVKLTSDDEIEYVDYMFPLHLVTCIHDVLSEVTPINIEKSTPSQLCGCYPASLKYDRHNYFNFGKTT